MQGSFRSLQQVYRRIGLYIEGFIDRFMEAFI